MTNRRVLDSFAIIAFLENEGGAEEVAKLIKHARDAEKPLLMSVVNWGEVYYIFKREAGKAVADKALSTIDTLPIELILADRELTLEAAEFKSSKKMSYGDCFAAALAKMKKAELVTGDREFEEVADQIKILWLKNDKNG